MKNLKYVLLAVALLVEVGVTDISRPPDIPEYYQGYVTINGSFASNGTIIEVKVNGTGEVVGNTTVIDSNGTYFLEVLFDVKDGKNIDEGADIRDLLVWYVNGVPADRPKPATDTADPGGVNELFIVSVGETPLKILDYSPQNTTQWINENTSITFTVTVIGAADANLTYQWTVDEIEVSKDKSFIYEYPVEYKGAKKIRVNVNDEQGNLTSQEWNVITNTPPRIYPPIPVINLSILDIISINLTEYGRDNETESEELEWRVVSDAFPYPPAFAYIDKSTQTLTVIPNLVSPWDGEILLTLTDLGKASVTQKLNINNTISLSDLRSSQTSTTIQVQRVEEHQKKKWGASFRTFPLFFLAMTLIILFLADRPYRIVIVLIILALSVMLVYLNFRPKTESIKLETIPHIKPVPISFQRLHEVEYYLKMCDGLFEEDDSISAEFRKNECYTSIGVLYKNSSICERIIDFADGEKKYECYVTNAIMSGDPKICRGTGTEGLTASCVYEYAQRLDDHQLCEVINQSYVQGYKCYRHFHEQKNTTIPSKYFSCETDSDCVPPTECHPSECINKKYSRWEALGFACTAHCAGGTFDCCWNCGCFCINNTCTAFLNTYEDQRAELQKQAIDALNKEGIDRALALCEAHPLTLPKNPCYTTIANEVGKNNTLGGLEVCRMIDAAEIKDSCIFSIVRVANSTDKSLSPICLEISDNFTEGDCIAYLLEKIMDLNICKNYKGYADPCNKVAGFLTNDSSFCEKIENDTIADECFYEIALRLQNTSLCEKIQSKKKSSCIKYTSPRKRKLKT